MGMECLLLFTCLPASTRQSASPNLNSNLHYEVYRLTLDIDRRAFRLFALLVLVPRFVRNRG